MTLPFPGPAPKSGTRASRLSWRPHPMGNAPAARWAPAAPQHAHPRSTKSVRQKPASAMGILPSLGSEYSESVRRHRPGAEPRRRRRCSATVCTLHGPPPSRRRQRAACSGPGPSYGDRRVPGRNPTTHESHRTRPLASAAMVAGLLLNMVLPVRAMPGRAHEPFARTLAAAEPTDGKRREGPYRPRSPSGSSVGSGGVWRFGCILLSRRQEHLLLPAFRQRPAPARPAPGRPAARPHRAHCTPADAPG